MKTRAILAVAVIGGLVLGGWDADGRRKRRKPLPTVFLDCATTWGDDPGEGSFRLGNNLNCPDDGLTIARGGITVDLGGHRLTGPDSAATPSDVGVKIGVGAPISGVVVRNGVIGSFDRGVFLDLASRSRLENVVIVDSEQESVRILQGERNTVTGSTIVEGTSANSGAIGLTSTSGNAVTKNVLSGVSLRLGNSDGNTLSGNRVYGGTGPGIRLESGSEENEISGNRVEGLDTSGVLLIGDDVDANVVRANVVRGNGTFGIGVDDGDDNRIERNAATANIDGIVVEGSALGTVVARNDASANRTVGIEMADTSDGSIVRNTANENGDDGIAVDAGLTPVITRNTTNFNGYQMGLEDDSSSGGIVAPNGTGKKNKARGNDVAGAEQCSSADADLCVDGPAAPPPLTTCDQRITSARTLRNPLHCLPIGSPTAALRVAGDGYTLNLGRHLLIGGPNDGDSALEVSAGASDIRVVGGVMAGSREGVLFPSSSPAHGIRFERSLVARNLVRGVTMSGLDLFPDTDPVVAGHNRIDGATIVNNGAIGVLVGSAPRNVITSTTIADHSDTGLFLFGSQLNTVSRSSFIGNEGAISMISISGLQLPDRNVISRNAMIGNVEEGLFLFNASRGRFEGNVIRGSTVGPAVRLGGALGTGPGGSNDNMFEGNVVSGTAGDGVNVQDDSRRNRFERNTIDANDGDGIVLFGDVEDSVLLGNSLSENGADSPDAFDDGGVLVFEPVDTNEAPDLVSSNVANRNGFLATDTTPVAGNDRGFGIAIAEDTVGSGNRATGNDHPFECSPNSFC